jgi:hypothetical protein
MTTTDLATFTDPGTMSATWQYAETVARASMLPAAYRGKPADVLIAIGLGQAVGIPPAQSLYEIYVVNGRPSPSANLMAALVRRSGHKLRVDGNAESCTATLVRADDPDYPFTATWTIDQARAAGLANKDTWKQYPAAMLRARAIAEVVRMGASEAVLGMEYAAEEQRDIQDDRTVVLPRKTTGVDSLRDDLIPPTSEDVQDADVVEPDTEVPEPITAAQLKALHTLLSKAEMDRDAAIAWFCQRTDRDITSSKDLTKAEASGLIDALGAATTEADTLPVGGEA